MCFRIILRIRFICQSQVANPASLVLASGFRVRADYLIIILTYNTTRLRLKHVRSGTTCVQFGGSAGQCYTQDKALLCFLDQIQSGAGCVDRNMFYHFPYIFSFNHLFNHQFNVCRNNSYINVIKVLDMGAWLATEWDGCSLKMALHSGDRSHTAGARIKDLAAIWLHIHSTNVGPCLGRERSEGSPGR